VLIYNQINKKRLTRSTELTARAKKLGNPLAERILSQMAIQYSKATKKSIDAAVAKARAVKPRVKVLGFNSFEVTGSKGDCYHCSFTKDNAGDFVGLCDCPANRKSKVCYHLASVSSLYKQQVTERAQARSIPLEQASVTPSCEQEINQRTSVFLAHSCPDCGDGLDSDGFCLNLWCSTEPAPAGPAVAVLSPGLARDYADLFGA
jgi:hypothetical protein